MLTQLYIRNYAIVEQLELELRPGMTAITGETGAGKSIVIGALGLVLGDRADSTSVRENAERAEITASFDLAELPHVKQWLNTRDLDAQDECELRRVLTKDGRSRAYINGRPAPVQLLRELGEQLVDIHGQRDHQSLLRPEIQRQLLDEFANHQNLLGKLETLAGKWKVVEQELADLRSAHQDKDARLDLLRFQVGELETLALEPGEIEKLNEEHGRLANMDQLLAGTQQSLQHLYDQDEGSAYGLISQSVATLGALVDKDPTLANTVEILNNAQLQLQECGDELRNYGDRLELDPERLQWIDQRLGTIHELSRKHRVEDTELTQLTDRLRTELDLLGNADENLLELETKLAGITAGYLKTANILSKSRCKAAVKFSEPVTKIIQNLGMPGGRFEVAVRTDTDRPVSPTGMDRIEFMVNANPGSSIASLSKVASGGELSRISLAIHVIAANSSQLPSLVFDEVDTGIGGGIAEVVGQQLQKLGQSHQVLCITHLPQVAAQGEQHLQVSKLASKNSIRTQIIELSEQERVDEIARMLGGIELTKSSRTHAKEMIANGQISSARKGSAARNRMN